MRHTQTHAHRWGDSENTEKESTQIGVEEKKKSRRLRVREGERD